MLTGKDPREILEEAYKRAKSHLKHPVILNSAVQKRVEEVCWCPNNRAGARFLLACTLAKVHDPTRDIRKPYTEIGDPDSYSGRVYDETYITDFINKYNLPCNSTTAFLTPAFRTKNITLTTNVNLRGTPAYMYNALLQLLSDVENNVVTAEDLLIETIRCLILLNIKRKKRLEVLKSGLALSSHTLSAEDIVNLLKQHLQCKGSSRLPVLIVAAAYKVAEPYIQERYLPLESHNAADKQTGALGDLQITLVNDNNVITVYEMKARQVIKEDIDRALEKVSLKITKGQRIDHYVFITTEEIDEKVQEYAKSLYNEIGTEFVILDCIGFIRHFLHFFYRLRQQFLETYQELVLAEPESSVNQALKEAFLSLRLVAETAEETLKENKGITD